MESMTYRETEEVGENLEHQSGTLLLLLQVFSGLQLLARSLLYFRSNGKGTASSLVSIATLQQRQGMVMYLSTQETKAGKLGVPGQLRIHTVHAVTSAAMIKTL